MSDESADDGQYRVVINHEEQYSVWPLDLPPPAGWRAVGQSGSKADCLSFIRATWVDLRPLSLRRWMDEQSRK